MCVCVCYLLLVCVLGNVAGVWREILSFHLLKLWLHKRLHILSVSWDFVLILWLFLDQSLPLKETTYQEVEDEARYPNRGDCRNKQFNGN